MRARDDRTPSVRKLEARALEAHRAAARAHARLKDFVQQENGRRLRLLAIELERAGLGWCRRCSRLKPRDALKLYLRRRRSSSRHDVGHVVPLCSRCHDQLSRLSTVEIFEVRTVGVCIEYRRGRSWLPVPSGEWNHPERYAPTHVSTRMATRFEVLPSFYLDRRSKPPALPPTVEVL